MPYKNKDKNREYQKIWARKHRKNRRNRTRKLRKKVLEKLGGKCIYCGCDNFIALEINHKNNDGGIERRKYCHKSFYYAILNGSREITDLELTCRICNAYYYLKNVLKVDDDWNIRWGG